jgi:CubicO group peptidase (beta-lactamase class C family)
MRERTLTAIGGSLLLTLHVSAQAPAPALDPTFKAPPPRFADPDRRSKLATAFGDIDTLFRGFAEKSRVPGAAWGIVIDGQLAHTGTFGYRDPDAKAPVEPDTVFRIASMTKSFTAVAILALRDDGKLSLDDPAEKYVPELKSLAYPSSDAPRITIRHLLTHSEGFPEDNPWGDQQLAVTDRQMADMMRGGIPFSNAPGVAYEYSNYGFAILGRIVTRVSGMSYNDYVSRRIFQPLGMRSTTMEARSVPKDKLARGYRYEGERWKDEPLLPDGAFGAMGGMLTSVADLGRYVSAMLDAWPPRDGPERGPISRASLREMQQIARYSNASASKDQAGAVQLSASGYGYGLRVAQTCVFRHDVSHGGGLPGFGSLMRWLPEHGVGIITFGNLTYTGWGRSVTAAFDRLAQTGGLQPRAFQPSPALIAARNSVSRLIAKWDDGLAKDIAAVNLFMDQSADRRRTQIEALKEKVGACAADEDRFDFVENALRGLWIVNCERGKLLASITLAPTTAPSVQFLSVRPAPAGDWRPQNCSQ